MKELKLMKRHETTSTVFLYVGITTLFLILSVTDYNCTNFKPIMLLFFVGLLCLFLSAVFYWPNVFIGYVVSAACVCIAFVQSKIKHPKKCYLILTLRNNCSSYKELMEARFWFNLST